MKVSSKARKSWIFAGAAILICGGTFWAGIVAVRNLNSRMPAAIQRPSDYSHLEGEALARASKERLLKSAALIYDNGQFGITLGNFSLLHPGLQETRSACEVYPRLRFTFRAADMAVNGEPPALVVDGPCLADPSQSAIEPLMVPYSEISQSPPRDKEFSNFSDGSVTVRVENLSDSWPRAWILGEVELRDETGASGVVLSDRDVRDIRGTPFVVDVK